MGEVRFIWRPLDKWPREQTKNRGWSPFRRKWEPGAYGSNREIAWTTTKPELELELRSLRVREVVVQLALKDRDIRIDGEIRANANPAHPGVIVTFTHPTHGPVTYACDKWDSWQANIRGITKGLEALRLVSRYGISESDEQYVGYRQLQSGTPLSPTDVAAEAMSIEQAGRIVAGWISGPHDLAVNARKCVEDEDFRRYAYRAALKGLHPDVGGEDTDGFLRLQRAYQMLEDNQ